MLPWLRSVALAAPSWPSRRGRSPQRLQQSVALRKIAQFRLSGFPPITRTRCRSERSTFKFYCNPQSTHLSGTTRFHFQALPWSQFVRLAPEPFQVSDLFSIVYRLTKQRFGGRIANGQRATSF